MKGSTAKLNLLVVSAILIIAALSPVPLFGACSGANLNKCGVLVPQIDCAHRDKVSIANLCITSDRKLRFDYHYTGSHLLKSIRFDYVPAGNSAVTAQGAGISGELKTGVAVPSSFDRIAGYAVTYLDDYPHPGGNDPSCYEKLAITPKLCPEIRMKLK